MDYDVYSYTKSELIDILELDTPTRSNILYKCQLYIGKFNAESNPVMAQFFEDVKHRLLSEEDDLDEMDHDHFTEEDDLVEGFENNNALVVSEKPPEIPSKDPITPSLAVAYKPGDLNPTLKQTTVRILNIDSRYREDKQDLCTNYTFSLSTPLRDVLSMKVYSVAIPYSWYTIDTAYGSNFIYLKAISPGINNGHHDYMVDIPTGNYSTSSLVSTVNTSLQSHLKVNDPSNQSLIEYSASNGIATTTIYINKNFNELDYEIKFGGETDPSGNIATFLGIVTPPFVGNQHKRIGNIPGTKFVTTSSPSRLALYTINENNNTFWIYITNDGASVNDNSYDASVNLVVDTSYAITIPNGTYDINQIITNINTSFANNPNLYSSPDNYSSIYLSDSITNADNTISSLINIEIYVTKTSSLSNYRTTLYFPGAPTDTNLVSLATILTFLPDHLYPVQYIYPITTIVSNRHLIFNNNDLSFNNKLYLNCVKPGYTVSANNYIVNIPVSDSVGYTTSDLANAMNTGFANANTTYNNKLYGCSATINTNGKMETLINLQNIFTNTDYIFDLSGTYFQNAKDENNVSWFSDASYSLTSDAILLSNTFYPPGIITSSDVSGIPIFRFTPISAGNILSDPISIYVPSPGDAGYTFIEFITQLNEQILSYGTSIAGTSVIIKYINSQQIKLQVSVNISVVLTEKDYQLVFPTNFIESDPYFYLYHILNYNNPTTITEDVPIVSLQQIDQGSFPIHTYSNNNVIYFNALTDGVYTTSGVYDVSINILPIDASGTSYSQEGLIKEIQRQMDASPLLNGSSIFIKKIKATQELTLYYVYMSIVINKRFTESDYNMVFYDPTIYIKCNAGNQKTSIAKRDTTLGWILGYRENEYVLSQYLLSTGSRGAILSGSSAVDVNGPTYLYIVLDDYTQNHLNNGIITVAGGEKTITMPSKSYGDFVYTCDTSGNDLIVSGNSLTSARKLTQKQLFALNSINNNQRTINNNNDYTYTASTKDVLAMIPIKPGQTGSTYVEFGGTLQAQSRTYFGPVNITRMNIKLVNDKGDIVNLNGTDWSFSVLCESLYQYS